MTPLRYELRRGVIVVILPLLVLLHSLVVYRLIWPNTAVWLNMSSAVVAGNILSGPLAAAMAAWIAMRERRRRTEYLRLTSARGDAAAPAIELLACVIVVLIAYTVALIGGIAKVIFQATWSGPNWAWIGVGALGLVLLTVVGYFLGRLLPKLWTPPLVALICYVYSGWNLGHSGKPWAYLSPVSQQDVSVFRSINSTMLLGQFLWYCGLTALLVSVGVWVVGISKSRPNGIQTIPIAVSLAVSTLGAVVVVSQHGRFLERQHDVAYRCSATQPVVCVHPAFAKGLPQLSQLFASLEAKLNGTPASFSRVEQLDRSPQLHPTPGAGRFGLDSLSEADLQYALSDYLDWANIGGPACLERSMQESDSAANVQLVRSWLVNSMAEFQPTGPAQIERLKWFRSLTEVDRRKWFRENYASIASCSIPDSAFGG